MQQVAEGLSRLSGGVLGSVGNLFSSSAAVKSNAPPDSSVPVCVYLFVIIVIIIVDLLCYIVCVVA